MNKLNDNIAFPCGISMKNRFMLAPLTNTQSFEDGTLSDDEFLRNAGVTRVYFPSEEAAGSAADCAVAAS